MPGIPDKQYFKIGEVSRITEVKPHVLRYWESEFRFIRPQKSRTNQRLYRRKDVELLLTIKRLLYQEGYTIAGANKKLREISRSQTQQADGDGVEEVVEAAKQVRVQLAELLRLTERDDE